MGVGKVSQEGGLCCRVAFQLVRRRKGSSFKVKLPAGIGAALACAVMATAAPAAEPEGMARGPARRSARRPPASPLPLPLLLALLVLPAPAAGAPVPLLLWSSSRDVWAPPENAHEGHITTETQLFSSLEPALEKGPRSVLLFLQEGLTLEDFTAYGAVPAQQSAFPHLQSALALAPSSLILPAVDRRAAGAVASHLAEKLGARVLAADRAALRELRLSRGGPALLLLRLPCSSGPGALAPRAGLTANDELLGQVLGALASQGVPYWALLTGVGPSPRVVRDLALAPGGRGGRNSRAKPPSLTTLLPVSYRDTEPRILLWAQNFTVTHKSEVRDLTAPTFGAPTPNLTGSSWNDSFAQLVLTYNDLFGAFLTIKFILSNRYYPISAQNWFTMDRLELHINDTSVVFKSPHVTAPSIYSFHCQYVSTELSKGGLLMELPDSDWHVTLQDFQIQAFNLSRRNFFLKVDVSSGNFSSGNLTSGYFSYASDCAGFFSAGIWMGLISSCIMLLIFTYSLHMILNLKTMDHFDNPKESILSMPQTD